jgi:hypothetical protein
MYHLLETNYFIRPTAYRTRSLTDIWAYTPAKWIRGRQMNAPSEPMRVELWENGGAGLAEIFLDTVPLFHGELVKALQEAGVDNLQTFPAILTTPAGQEIENYLATNIVGLVKCADLAASEYDDIGGTGLIAMGFRKLVIDERAARGARLFRLAEAVASIIVHEDVKTMLDLHGFKYLSWRELA